MKEINDLQVKIKSIVENYDKDLFDGWIIGDGPIPCPLLFIGEAPGKTEIQSQKPFVGLAGKTFEKYLNSIGLSKSAIRITNTCFFRPIKKKLGKSGKMSISNRPPKKSEIALFHDILMEEVQLTQPKLIITLGNIPLNEFTSFHSIGTCHGALYWNNSLKVNIFPMYHPSSLTYNRSETFHRTYEEDWKKLKETLKSLNVK